MNIDTSKGSFPMEMLDKRTRIDTSTGQSVTIVEYWLGGELVRREDSFPNMASPSVVEDTPMQLGTEDTPPTEVGVE